MNQMNFFGWIRDGVRQSVLLGVSDAVEQLGSPAAAEEFHPSVAAFLQNDRTNADGNGTPKIASKPGNNPKTRKRLGKSLKDIGTENA